MSVLSEPERYLSVTHFLQQKIQDDKNAVVSFMVPISNYYSAKLDWADTTATTATTTAAALYNISSIISQLPDTCLAASFTFEDVQDLLGIFGEFCSHYTTTSTTTSSTTTTITIPPTVTNLLTHRTLV